MAQNYSRLVIDCNRDPSVATSIPTIGGANGRDPRQHRPHRRRSRGAPRRDLRPYHRQVRALLDERPAAGRTTILVAQHSMTNIFKGVRREMHAAVLYNRDRRFAGLVLEALRGEPGLVSATTSPISSATKPTTPSRVMARRAACRTSRSRFVRT